MTNNNILYRNNHPSKIIEINEKKIEVDEDLIPLVLELNKIGLKTQSCCQGSKEEYASICFDLDESLILLETEALPNKKIKITMRWPHKFEFD